MFGIKKDLSDNFITDSEGSLDTLSNIIKEKNSNNSKFIFYDREQKFLKQLEIYAELNIENSPKVVIIIDNTDSTNKLCEKIIKAFEKYPEYQELKNLRVEKINNIEISEDKKIESCLNNGDVVYCDLNADEIWIKTNLSIISLFGEYNFYSELKFDGNISFKKFKFTLIKYGIEIWLNQKKRESSDFHFIISNIIFNCDKDNFNSDINNQSEIDDIKIKDFFGFKGYIAMTIRFQTLESLMFQKLKIISPKNENTKKWKEFKKMNFQDFFYNNKFINERHYVIKKIKNFLSKERFDKIYLYFHKSTYIYDDQYEDENNKDTNKEFTIIVIPNKFKNRRAEKRLTEEFSFNKLIDLKDNRISKPINEDDNDSQNKSLILGKTIKKKVRRKDSYINSLQHYIINSDLCKDFDDNFYIKDFKDFIEGFYKIKIKKGDLENLNLPEFRNSNDNTIDNKKKSNELKDFLDFNKIYIKKVNINLLIYSIWLGVICCILCIYMNEKLF